MAIKPYDIAGSSSGGGGGGEVNTGLNIGTGTGVYAQKVGTVLQFKTLKAGNNINITSTANEVTIDASAAGEANTASNLGTGQGVYAQKSGVDLQLKSIKAGTNTTVTSDATSITVSVPTIGEANTISSVGAGETVVKGKTGVDLQVKSIVAGSNVTLTPATDTLTIAVPAVGEVNTASNIGIGEGVYAQKVGADIQLKSITTWYP